MLLLFDRLLACLHLVSNRFLKTNLFRAEGPKTYIDDPFWTILLSATVLYQAAFDWQRGEIARCNVLSYFWKASSP